MIFKHFLAVFGFMCLTGGLPFAASASPGDLTEVHTPRDGRELLLHYPGIRAVTDDTVIFADGATLPYDDHRSKTLDEKLANASIKDHFAQVYPAFAPIAAPAPGDDPGRFRNDALLKKLYGANRAEINKNLVAVRWLPRHGGRKLLFNGNEQAGAQLQKVSDELDALPGEYMKFLKRVNGTYSYRKIAGTNRLSAHSYGIAIDLDARHSRYWQWDRQKRYRNDIPQQIIDIFEKHGFVWGGRWYHYDTMHFEYRPEMIENLVVAGGSSRSSHTELSVSLLRDAGEKRP